MFFSFGPKGGGVLASPKNTYLKIPIFQKGENTPNSAKKSYSRSKNATFCHFLYIFGPFWSLSEKNDYFLPFFSLRGGGLSCPIQKKSLSEKTGGQKEGGGGSRVF